MLTLNRSGPDELHRGALAANAIATLYAAVVTQLLAAAGLVPTDVTAVGAHGRPPAAAFQIGVFPILLTPI